MSTLDLRDAIILDEDDGALMGEPADDLQRAVDAGILYVCTEEDCPNGKHRGGPFLHYSPGKAPDDYDWLLYGADDDQG